MTNFAEKVRVELARFASIRSLCLTRDPPQKASKSRFALRRPSRKCTSMFSFCGPREIESKQFSLDFSETAL